MELLVGVVAEVVAGVVARVVAVEMILMALLVAGVVAGVRNRSGFVRGEPRSVSYVGNDVWRIPALKRCSAEAGDNIGDGGGLGGDVLDLDLFD